MPLPQKKVVVKAPSSSYTDPQPYIDNLDDNLNEIEEVTPVPVPIRVPVTMAHKVPKPKIVLTKLVPDAYREQKRFKLNFDDLWETKEREDEDADYSENAQYYAEEDDEDEVMMEGGSVRKKSEIVLSD